MAAVYGRQPPTPGAAGTIAAMSAGSWDRAAALVPVRDGRARPEIAALEAGLPSLSELFTFMRDAELRFRTLRMRIEERTVTARGDRVAVIDIAIEHPGLARVTTSEPGLGTAGDYDLWLSDGEIVRTYNSRHRLGTSRPVRGRPRGLDRDLPGTSRVYSPLTALPADSLAELFVHPAGYCQNVLATGRCRVAGTTEVVGREAIVIECDTPRAVERTADRPDFRVQVTADRHTGLVVRLVQSMGDVVTREAVATALEPDAILAPGTFDFEFPAGTNSIY
jgi:hypothetical protein